MVSKNAPYVVERRRRKDSKQRTISRLEIQMQPFLLSHNILSATENDHPPPASLLDIQQICQLVGLSVSQPATSAVRQSVCQLSNGRNSCQPKLAKENGDASLSKGTNKRMAWANCYGLVG